MSVLITGMEMPTEGTVIAIYKLNGQFFASVHGTELCPLILVPPHGDLIDVSTKVTVQIYDDMYEEFHDEECTIADVLDRWSNEGCPEAIIPAEEGTQKEEG